MKFIDRLVHFFWPAKLGHKSKLIVYIGDDDSDQSSQVQFARLTPPKPEEKQIQLLVRGLRGEGGVLRFETPYTGLFQNCPLCSERILRILLTHHIMTSCKFPRNSREIVVIIAPDSDPEPHWEKD